MGYFFCFQEVYILSNKSDLDLFYRSRHIEKLLKELPPYDHNKWLKKSLKSLAKLVKREKIDRLEWKILSATLKDLEKGFRLFSNYRDTRKITIFGSARTSPNTPEYNLALDFAKKSL